MYHEGAGVPHLLAVPDRRRRARRPYRTEPRASERVRMFGGTVDLLRPEEVLHRVENWVETGKRSLVVTVSALGLLRLQHAGGSERRLHAAADLVLLNSAAVARLGRTFGAPSRRLHRCAYADWRDHFWSLADRKAWRVLYLAGEKSDLDGPVDAMRAAYPGAVITWRTFDPRSHVAAMAHDLGEFEPDIVLVGPAAGRAAWAAAILEHLPPCVVLMVDTGLKRQAAFLPRRRRRSALRPPFSPPG